MAEVTQNTRVTSYIWVSDFFYSKINLIFDKIKSIKQEW